MGSRVLTVAICDDEPAQTAYLSALAGKWAGERDITLRLSDFESAERFLFAYEEREPPDILLLDIQMKGMTAAVSFQFNISSLKTCNRRRFFLFKGLI
jgi:DNA-binding LytR/AlgR family response regulator